MTSEALQQDPAAGALRLPAALDLNAARPLAAELIALRGHDLVIDASDVSRVGGQCLQVLLSARATWAADGLAFSIVEPSDDFAAALNLLGAADLCSNPSFLEPRS